MAKKRHGQPSKKPKEPKKKEGSGTFKKRLPYLLFTLCCYAACFLLCAFLALQRETADADFYMLILFLGMAALLCSFLAAKKEKQRGLLIGFLTTLPAHVLLFGLSLLLGQSKADLRLLLSFIILSLISMLGGVLGVNRREKPKHSPARR